MRRGFVGVKLLVATAVEDQRLRLRALPEVFDFGDVEKMIARLVHINDTCNHMRETARNHRNVAMMFEAQRQVFDRAAGEVRTEMLLRLGQDIDAIAVTDSEVVDDRRFPA
jgi:hypothetical protein